MQNPASNFGGELSEQLSESSLLKRNLLKREHPKYEVKLQQGQLLVKLSHSGRTSLLSSRDKQFLTEWLQYCPARLIRIDPALGAAVLQLWADTCMQTGKVIFLRVPPEHKLPKRQRRVSWWLKRLIDWIVAVSLLTVLSPVLLGLSLLVYFLSKGSVFSHQWCVGERGKLFRMLKFRTTSPSLDQQDSHKRKDDLYTTPIGRWMRKYSLDKLPQLLNVVRGEMSLVGPPACTLNDAVGFSSDSQKRLNALPGLVGAWQVRARTEILDLETINHCELMYLSSWSLLKDLRIILISLSQLECNLWTRKKDERTS